MRPFTLTISRTQTVEKWERVFDGKKFPTQFYLKNDQMVETFGILKLHMKLRSDDNNVLHYEYQKSTVLGIKIPSFIAFKTCARCIPLSETTWQFHIELLSPNDALILKYWGKAKIWDEKLPIEN